MAVFAQTFDKTKPLGSELANTLDTTLQNMQYAINERYELEHIALDSSATGATEATNPQAQGRHNPGKVSSFYIGTTAQIAALTGMCTGAHAVDTTLKVIKVYNGTDWTTWTFGGIALSNPTTLVTANITSSDITGISDWTNMLDGSDSTLTDEGTVAAGATSIIYTDLGAVYDGYIRLVGDFKSGGASNAVYMYCLTAYDYVSILTGFTVALTTNYNELSGNHGFGMVIGTTYRTFSTVQRFYGRYVGMAIAPNTAAGYVKMRRFDVYK